MDRLRYALQCNVPWTSLLMISQHQQHDTTLVTIPDLLRNLVPPPPKIGETSILDVAALSDIWDRVMSELVRITGHEQLVRYSLTHIVERDLYSVLCQHGYSLPGMDHYAHRYDQEMMRMRWAEPPLLMIPQQNTIDPGLVTVVLDLAMAEGVCRPSTTRHGLSRLNLDSIDLACSYGPDTSPLRQRRMSSVYLNDRPALPRWFTHGTAATDTVRFRTADGSECVLTKDRISVVCRRSAFFHDNRWESMVGSAGMDIADCTIDRITTRLVCHVRSCIPWTADVMDVIIDHDPLLKWFIRKGQSDVPTTAMYWLDLFDSTRPVQMTIDRPRRSIWSVTLQGLFSDDEAHLARLILCQLGLRAQQTASVQPARQQHDGLDSLRRALPAHILSNYTREASVLPVVLTLQQARDCPRRVIRFPRDDPHGGVYLTAPESYFIGIKYSVLHDILIPVCYKTDHMLNRNSQTWKYYLGGQPSQNMPSASMATIMSSLRMLSPHRMGSIPERFASLYGLGSIERHRTGSARTGYVRLGMGSSLMRCVSYAIHRCTAPPMLVPGQSSSEGRMKVGERTLFAVVCMQEYGSMPVHELQKELLAQFTEDRVDIASYRAIEELFDVNLVIHLIRNNDYLGPYIPPYDDVYLWTANPRRKTVVVFQNTFHRHVTYELLGYYGGVGLAEPVYCWDSDHAVAAAVLRHMASLTYRGLGLQRPPHSPQLISRSGKCYGFFDETGQLVRCYDRPENSPVHAESECLVAAAVDTSQSRTSYRVRFESEAAFQSWYRYTP